MVAASPVPPSSPRESATPPWMMALVAVLVLAFFFFTRARFLLGDAAAYAHQIETGDFNQRSLHLFYYVLGWLFVHATRPLGIPTDTALISLSGILMTIVLGLSWRLFHELGEDDRTAAWGVFAMLFAGVVIQQGTEAEVYAPQLVLTLGSYLLYLRRRPAWAGLLLGLATLTTPLGVLIVGFFAAEALRTRRWKPFVILGVVGSLTFLPVLAVVWRDYFYGTRGLLSDTRVSQSSDKAFDNAVALLKNLHFMLPFLVAGLVVAWRRRRQWIWLLAGLLVCHVLAILTVTENGVFLLPIYPVFAGIIAMGIVAGLGARGAIRALTIVSLALYTGLSLLIWIQPYDQKIRDGMLAGLRRVPPGSSILTSWSYAMTLEYYGGPPRDTLSSSRGFLWHERHPLVVQVLHSGAPVYLMEANSETRAVRWLYTPAMRREHYERFALEPRMQREFGVVATPYFSQPGGPMFYRLSLP
jgi:Glycosyltransferase family 87